MKLFVKSIGGMTCTILIGGRSELNLIYDWMNHIQSWFEPVVDGGVLPGTTATVFLTETSKGGKKEPQVMFYLLF